MSTQADKETKLLLQLFFQKNDPKNAGDAAIDAIIEMYKDNKLGAVEMWKDLSKQYFPRTLASTGSNSPHKKTKIGDSAQVPVPPALHAANFLRLRRFFDKYKPKKTDEEIGKALGPALKKYGGISELWSGLLSKYGPEPTFAESLPEQNSPAPRNPNLSGSRASGGGGSSSGGDGAPPVIDPQQFAEQFSRIRRFADIHEPHRTDEELKATLREAFLKPGGWSALWRNLTSHFGPEPSDPWEKWPCDEPDRNVVSSSLSLERKNDVAFQNEMARLDAFTRRYSKPKTNRELEEILLRSKRQPGGWNAMWEKLVRLYGPEVPATPPPPPLPQPPPQQCEVMSVEKKKRVSFLEEKEIEGELRRLRRFVDRYDPKKSDEQLRGILEKHRRAPGGWRAMWLKLVEAYGPEPQPW